ncbi:helix-turn-helix domain-containing protein [Myxococcus sp. AB025B]|uniref:helix-turn-helix domain-containing protein n=1 Tax=Myxococcus sp. AB025B TaxID=2562794 RepID=UPI001891B4BB|nr:helix-turn-helix transcriptional regulator [Myxococcus sp. AB025B]
MTQETIPLAVDRAVIALGANIARARLRRGLKQVDLAKKTGLGLGTIRRIEAGNISTAISAYFVVLWAMGLEREIENLASPDRDEEGKTLEAARQPERATSSGGLDADF